MWARRASRLCECWLPDERPEPEVLLEFLSGRVARWWLPERWAYVDELPKTSVGKFDKKALRADIAARLARG